MDAGEAVLCFKDSTVGCEICEELFTPDARVYQLRLMGVDLISNGSGSLHEVRKIDMRLEHIFHATKRVILLDGHIADHLTPSVMSVGWCLPLCQSERL